MILQACRRTDRRAGAGHSARTARVSLIAWVALAIAAVALPASSAAQDAAKRTEAGRPEISPEQMEQMMALIQPGKMHERLASFAGEWKTTMRMWEGPGEPIVNEGTMTGEMVLGGRYLVSRHKAEYRGMPFEGMGIDGYDNAKQQYISLWLDNFGTGVMQLTGRPTPDGQAIDYIGTMFDPMRQADSRIRQEFRHLDADRFLMTMYQAAPDGSGEVKVMEMTGVRVK